jgi:hypothetical protein
MQDGWGYRHSLLSMALAIYHDLAALHHDDKDLDRR